MAISFNKNPPNDNPASFTFQLQQVEFFSKLLVTPVHLALVILAVFDILTLYLLYKIVSRQTTDSFVPNLISLCWILSPYVLSTSVNGLETAISFFFIVAAFYQFQRIVNERENVVSIGGLIGLGVILGFAMLARVDNLLLVAAMSFTILVRLIKKRTSVPWMLSRLFILLAGAALIYLPWAIYSLYYTGDVYQMSGSAVRFMSLSQVHHDPTLVNWYLKSIWIGLLVLIRQNFGLLMMIGILIILIARKDRAELISVAKRASRLDTVPILFGITIFAAYTLYEFGQWYFIRYFYPLILSLLIILALAVDVALTSVLKSQRGKLALKVMLVSMVGLSCFWPTNLPSYFLSTDTQSQGYMNLGLWAQDRFRDGTIVGSCQTGALGYFATNLKVVNLDGVVNGDAFTAIRARRLMDYIRDTGVQFVIGWPRDNMKFIERESENFSSQDLTDIGPIKEFKSWGYEWHVYEVRRETNSEF